MSTRTIEVNYDGLVGSTHNYAGLAIGNLASEQNAELVSNPRAAVQEGLKKMLLMHQLGCYQAIIPPQPRPNFNWLKQLGYSALPADSRLVATAFSASSMWTANAATVSPSADCRDHRIHITPANLMSQAHRFHETAYSAHLLKQLFPDERYFHHHSPLGCASITSDEGAANHTRLCKEFGEPGLEIFVYGKSGFPSTVLLESQRYPARQSKIASESIARLHQLDPSNVIFLQQNPNAIDAGVFHNDVIAVGNQNLYFCHEMAYVDFTPLKNALGQRGFQLVIVTNEEVSLNDAVQTYLFNSQLVTLPDGSRVLVAPQECQENPRVKHYLDHQSMAKVQYVNCRQSMRNGGGPACLRLRVVMTEEELSAAHQGVMFSEPLFHRLMAWSEQYYRTILSPNDLLDPLLIEENKASLEALFGILKLSSVFNLDFSA
jgi:succinylarginine dihydrolase